VLLHGGEGEVGVAPPAHVGRDRLLHGYRPRPDVTHARTRTHRLVAHTHSHARSRAASEGQAKPPDNYVVRR
jgi:hypothetical protein